MPRILLSSLLIGLCCSLFGPPLEAASRDKSSLPNASVSSGEAASGVWMLTPQSIEQSNKINDEIEQQAQRRKAEQESQQAEAQAKKAKEDEERRKTLEYQREYINSFKREMAKPVWNVNQP